MATTKNDQTSGGKGPVKKATAPERLVLQKETIKDLQAMLKEAASARQSRRVCVA